MQTKSLSRGDARDFTQGSIFGKLLRLPMAYIMSIQPDASLTNIGLAVPTATVVGIVICTIYYRRMQKQL